MSEQESIELYARLRDCIRDAQRRMVERKAKLGEPVIIANRFGLPKQVAAAEALKLYGGAKRK